MRQGRAQPGVPAAPGDVSRQRARAVRDWSDAGPIPGDLDRAGGTVFTNRREIEIAASPAEAFAAMERIGGATGWYGTR